MIGTIHTLVEQYGLIAIFIGCLAEGESAAVFAGFLAHQQVFTILNAFIAVFAGAFLGDSAIFMLGRRFSAHPRVRTLTTRPGFERALDLVARYPAAYVLLNRYVYGFRLVGGIAAGLSTIPAPLFFALNALASAIWATLFLAFGYLFGEGAEQLLGGTLAKHERLLVGLLVAAAVALVAGLIRHRLVRKADE
jgi:membrane protein DedA with SNARE-associated domain